MGIVMPKIKAAISPTTKNPNDEITRVPKIKLTDKGSLRHAVFLNPERIPYIKRKMDKGYISNKTAADWMLSKPKVGDVFLELKGGDVMHAIEQICATADFADANGLVCGKKAGLVLCTEHPGFNTKMQRAIEAFVTKHRGPIHARNRSGEFQFEHVLSFKGPDRL